LDTNPRITFEDYAKQYPPKFYIDVNNVPKLEFAGTQTPIFRLSGNTWLKAPFIALTQQLNFFIHELDIIKPYEVMKYNYGSGGSVWDLSKEKFGEIPEEQVKMVTEFKSLLYKMLYKVASVESQINSNTTFSPVTAMPGIPVETLLNIVNTVTAEMVKNGMLLEQLHMQMNSVATPEPAYEMAYAALKIQLARLVVFRSAVQGSAMKAKADMDYKKTHPGSLLVKRSSNVVPYHEKAPTTAAASIWSPAVTDVVPDDFITVEESFFLGETRPKETLAHESGHLILANLIRDGDPTAIAIDQSQLDDVTKREVARRYIRYQRAMGTLDYRQAKEFLKGYLWRPGETFARDTSTFSRFGVGNTTKGTQELKDLISTGKLTQDDLNKLASDAELGSRIYQQGAKDIRFIFKALNIRSMDDIEALRDFVPPVSEYYGNVATQTDINLEYLKAQRRPKLQPVPQEELEAMMQQMLTEQYGSFNPEAVTGFAQKILASATFKTKTTSTLSPGAIVNIQKFLDQLDTLLIEKHYQGITASTAGMQVSTHTKALAGGTPSIPGQKGDFIPRAEFLTPESVEDIHGVWGTRSAKPPIPPPTQNVPLLPAGTTPLMLPSGVTTTNVPSGGTIINSTGTIMLQGGITLTGDMRRTEFPGTSGNGVMPPGGGPPIPPQTATANEDWEGLGGGSQNLNTPAKLSATQSRTKAILEKIPALKERLMTDLGKTADELVQGLSISATETDFGTTAIKGKFKNIKEGIDKKIEYYVQEAGDNAVNVLGSAEFKQAERRGKYDRTMAFRGELHEGFNAANMNFLQQNYGKAAEYFTERNPQLMQDPRTQVRIDKMGEISRATVRREIQPGIYETDRTLIDKYGNLLPDVSRKFADFTTALRNNIAQFFRWSLAVSLVYMPLQKLTQLVQETIDAQEKLVHVAITLGQSQASLGQIFESSYKIAQATGESLNGVIDGYNQAVRATGAYVDQIERVTVAQKLLTDSITLAKLSGMQQSAATDALVASLKQMSMPLDQGDKLLDKWVRTTKVANVDLNTLSTSFSIVAEAATQAGLNVDQLNGLIATVAEVSTLGAREVGNATRALISGYSSDRAATELGKFGISVKNAEGDAKDFMSVFTDIKTMFESGLISDDQLLKIAGAIGGGNRRQAQVVASIMNLNRVNEVASQSAKADQDAQKALAMEMNTVSTAITTLGNAFAKFGMTLGAQGGVLDLLENMAKILGTVLGAISSVSSILGTASPVLIAFGIALQTMKWEGFKGGIASMVGNITALKNNIGDVVPALFRKATFQQPTVQDMITTQTVKSQAKDLTAKSAQDGTAIKWGAVAATTFMGVLEASKGDVGGGLAIGLVGGIVSQWNPVAGILAGTLVSAIVGKIFENKQKIEEGLGQARKPEEGTAGATTTKAGTDTAYGRLLQAIFPETQQRGNVLYGEKPEDLLSMRTFGNQIQDIFSKQKAVPKNASAIEQIVAGLQRGNIQPGLPDEKIFEMIKQVEAETGVKANLENVPRFREMELNYRKAEEDKAAAAAKYANPEKIYELQKSSSQWINESFYTKGTISAKQYDDARLAIEKLGATVPKYLVPLGGSLRGLSTDVTPVTDAYKMFTDIIIKGTPQQIDELNTLKGSWEDLNDVILAAQKAGKSGRETTPYKGVDTRMDTLLKERAQAEEAYRNRIAQINREVLLATTPVPTIMKTALAPTAWPELQRGIEVEKEKTMKGLSETDAAVLAQQLANTTFYVEFSDGSKETITGASQDMINNAIQNNKELQAVLQKTLGFSIMKDVKPAVLDQAMAKYPQALAFVNQSMQEAVKKNPNLKYEPVQETAVMMFMEGGQFRTVIANQQILNALMEENNDLTRKQLEGVFNLPEGMSFWLPYQAWQYRENTGAGTSAFGTPKPEPVPDNTPETSRYKRNFSYADLAEYYKKIGYVPEPSQILPLEKPKQEWKAEDLRKFSEMGTPLDPAITLNSTMESLNSILERLIATLTGEGEKTIGTKSNKDYSVSDIFKIMAEPFQEFWNSQFNSGTTGGGGTGGGTGGTTGTMATPRNRMGSETATAAMPAIQAKLTLTIDNRSTLVVDGRALANVIKTYIMQDLLRFAAATGAASANYTNPPRPT
jgi:TP901 family phage tail tape measure protein